MKKHEKTAIALTVTAFSFIDNPVSQALTGRTENWTKTASKGRYISVNSLSKIGQSDNINDNQNNAQTALGNVIPITGGHRGHGHATDPTWDEPTTPAPAPAPAPVKSHRAQAAWAELRSIFVSCDLGDFLPENWELDPQHERSLAASGISPEAAAAAGIISLGHHWLQRLGIARNSYEIGEKLCIFLYLDPWGRPYTHVLDDGTETPFCRARLNAPRGSQKYVQPPKSGIRPYFPRVPAMGQWARRAGYDDGSETATGYPELDAIVSEGEKKSLKATLDGFPTIGIGGVWNFRGSDLPIHRDLWLIIARLRSVTIIFDNDCSHKPQVTQAANSLIQGILDMFAVLGRDPKEALKNVRDGKGTRHPSTYIYWSLLPQTIHGDKIGLDDLLLHEQGREILTRLLDVRLPGIVTIESGKNKDGSPKTVEQHPAYLSEPAGDHWLCRHLPRHRQEHMRRVLTESAMLLSDILPIENSHPYTWDRAAKIWSTINSETWAAFPSAIADKHHWQNRNAGLMATCHTELLKHTQKQGSFNPLQLVGFENGDYDPATGELLPIRPQHRLVSRIAAPWIPGMSCRNFEDWLVWLWDADAEKISLFQAALRWTLEPKQPRKFGAYENSCEVIFGLVGKAGRGKGSLLEVLLALFGESSARNFSITDAANPNRIRNLVGSQIAIDTDAKGRLDELTIGALNKIASNESMDVKALYKDLGEARLNTVLWFAANRMPRTPSAVEDSEGWHRRVITFPFSKKPECRSANFLRPIMRELPGIIQWAWAMPISEATGIISDRQQRGPSEQEIQEELDGNSIYLWLSDFLAMHQAAIEDSRFMDAEVAVNGKKCVIRKGVLSVNTMNDMRTEYSIWCEQNREKHPFGRNRFNESLRDIGVRELRKETARWVEIPMAALDLTALVRS